MSRAGEEADTWGKAVNWGQELGLDACVQTLQAQEMLLKAHIQEPAALAGDFWVIPQILSYPNRR